MNVYHVGVKIANVFNQSPRDLSNTIMNSYQLVFQNTPKLYIEQVTGVGLFYF